VLLGFLAGCSFMGGVWLIVTGLRRPRQRGHDEQVEPAEPTPLADEAWGWFKSRRPALNRAELQ
jgi:hypothetical protein